jgi:UPF0755 protein
MADGRERTAEEREAARQDRERRRAGIDPDPDEHLPPVGRRAEPPPTVEHDVLADEPDGARDEPDEPHEPDDAYADPDHGYPDPDGRYDDSYEDSADPYDDDPEPLETERPSGTRRVSRLEGSGRRSRPRPVRRARQPRARRPAPAERRRGHSWLGRMVAVIMVVLAAALIWFAVELFQPFGTSPHGEVTVTVPAHSHASQIGDLLAREGVIPSGFFFEVRTALAGDRSKLRAGTYRLQQGMSYSAVLTRLTTPPPAVPTTQLTIAEGHTRQYVARLLRAQGVKGNYLAATRSSPLLDPHDYGAPRHVPSLEGFLFPDTFQLVKPVKMSALVADQLRDFKQRFAGVNLSYARSKHLTAYDVLTIASLVEAEAASAKDRPLVASVIYNRLRDGMMLQFDSTTRYATGNFTHPLTVSQLKSTSPYNTHTHLGLPPTPINSPSMASIQAAAHPARSNYLYFFTKPCNAGGSVFTSTYSQFLHLLAVDRRNHC